MSLFNSPIVRKAGTRKASKTGERAAINPVVEPVKQIKFIVDHAAVKENDQRSESEIARAAFSLNKTRTILALFESGRSPGEIATLLGFAADSKEFAHYVRDAKFHLKCSIAGATVAEKINPEFSRAPVVNDGILEHVDVLAKAAKAAVEALFNNDNTITVSLMKGATTEINLTDALRMSKEELAKLKKTCKEHYSKTFRTRDVQKLNADNPLAMYLAKVVATAPTPVE